ncbi:type VI secretion protein [Sphingomonas glacialis]|uniref:Type VI secretion protein n=1 Tax=Sphingomonas glacialis TaxID=658225 RepID=A0ABQ3LRJ7_9SPHN|nr:DUF3363 domain-containing protein [Sphingomonas glacialis]GHH24196.1 type VI secretion protein [Sphingomonas glacialis]
MSKVEDLFRVRPGKSKARGAGSGRRLQSLAALVKTSAMRSGALYRRMSGRGGGTGHLGRGRSAALLRRPSATSRRVVVKARVVRHTGSRFRSAPLARHVIYLERDGVTRDGRDAAMFGPSTDAVDSEGFAGRCEDDRHHFRFIVSPEDATELEDLRTFTRELMADMAHDLDTELDWVAVDHWNTDNPHVHILVRGRMGDGQDLVIDRDYIRAGLRTRAEERATLELGPRSEREIRAALDREIDADRFTSLDRQLLRQADRAGGLVDLRPDPSDADPDYRRQLVGRAMKLERLGLFESGGPACWTVQPNVETTLRDLSIRGDIIKTMHRAMSAGGAAPDMTRFALHRDTDPEPVLGRLVERGLHDELTGTAYAVIDGVDGRTHHVRFADIDMTGDARPGAIVELRSWDDGKGRQRLSLATRSDLSLADQISASGATWLDRQLVARDAMPLGEGFGEDVREALGARTEHLVGQGLAVRQGQRTVFAQQMLGTLKGGELDEATRRIAERTGLPHVPSKPGEFVSGVYRERVTLGSGRFAMIDDGLSFQLVPWRPALDQHLGRHITGTIAVGGGVDWSIGRQRGLGL